MLIYFIYTVLVLKNELLQVILSSLFLQSREGLLDLYH